MRRGHRVGWVSLRAVPAEAKQRSKVTVVGWVVESGFEFRWGWSAGVGSMLDDGCRSGCVLLADADDCFGVEGEPVEGEWQRRLGEVCGKFCEGAGADVG